MPAVFISGSGSVLVEGFQAAVCVMIVFSIPAPLSVIPAFGSRGASFRTCFGFGEIQKYKVLA